MAFSSHALRAFLVVAEEMHYGRAAKRLHTSQPPLSRTIQRLEEDVGARLFDRRSGWGIALTDSGKYFVERARAILAEADHVREVARRLSRGEEGTLTIGYTPTATYEVLPALLRAYRKRRPRIVVDLVEMRSALVPDALLSTRIDVGIACGPLRRDDVDERILARDRFVLAVPKRHALASKRRVRIRDVDGLDLVVVDPTLEPAWASLATTALTKAGVVTRTVQTTDSKIAMLGLVAAGLGCSIVTESMRVLGRAGVRYVEIADLAARPPIVALVPREASVRARDLLALADEVLRTDRSRS